MTTALWGLGSSARHALIRLVDSGARTTALAADHSIMLTLVTRGYVTASEPIEAIRQAAGAVPGVRIPSGTFPVTYTPTPEGTALVEAHRG